MHSTLHVHLLDISRQLACMKLGRREKYQPIQYCWAGCLGYPVHTCHLPIAVPRQDSMSAAGTHAVLSGHCNIHVHVHKKAVHVHVYSIVT